MKLIVVIFIISIVLIVWLRNQVQAASTTHKNPEAGSIYDFTVKTIDGKDISLGEYKGKVLLIVNTASQCGFTSQYKGLEAIYQQYKDQGFEILAFPANNFLGQEPGSNEQIKKFCELKFKTSFPLFSKISVKGQDKAPLYSYLTTQKGFAGDITWNFNKFLIDRTGKLRSRFDSKVEPQSKEMIEQINKLLAQ